MTFHSKTIVIFLLILLASCGITINYTKDQKLDMCSIHDVKLKKKHVKRIYGRSKEPTVSTENCPYAKRPYGGGKIMPFWPQGRLALVYTCDSCTIVYRQLKKEATRQEMQ